MAFHSIFENVGATPLYLLLLLAILLLAMHLILVMRFKLSNVAWKKTDYFWLGAAVIGLLASGAEANHFLAERYLQHSAIPRAEASYKFLRELLIEPYGICAQHVRSEFSPSYFDQIVQEQQALCKKSKDIGARMPETLQDYPPLEETGFVQFGQHAKYEIQFIQDVNFRAEEYRRAQKEYAEYKEATETSFCEDLSKVLGPILLTFAIALRITKVTGEIRNARQEAK